MGRGGFSSEMANELTRLMACLVSSERQDVLFDRISEGDPDDLEQLGNLTVSSAEKGITWWGENETVLNLICQRFKNSLVAVGVEVGIDIGSFLEQWSLDSWADFISETFDCQSGFGHLDNFDYFFDYAVRQSLGFPTQPNDDGDSWGTRGLEVSIEDWGLISSVFQSWWQRDDLFEILTFAYEITKSGRDLVNVEDLDAENVIE